MLEGATAVLVVPAHQHVDDSEQAEHQVLQHKQHRQHVVKAADPQRLGHAGEEEEQVDAERPHRTEELEVPLEPIELVLVVIRLGVAFHPLALQDPVVIFLHLLPLEPRLPPARMAPAQVPGVQERVAAPCAHAGEGLRVSQVHLSQADVLWRHLVRGPVPVLEELLPGLGPPDLRRRLLRPQPVASDVERENRVRLLVGAVLVLAPGTVRKPLVVAVGVLGVAEGGRQAGSAGLAVVVGSGQVLELWAAEDDGAPPPVQRGRAVGIDAVFQDVYDSPFLDQLLDLLLVENALLRQRRAVRILGDITIHLECVRGLIHDPEDVLHGLPHLRGLIGVFVDDLQEDLEGHPEVGTHPA
mmetsp:Transcript_19360/g.51596  ORF Transcript_19360/g.51596 Transcript_19360/m.51596 type:complete len:356 (+) Transcript_19360:417-1484(+)